MNRHNNTNNAPTSARNLQPRDLHLRDLHPYARARDALLDEIDDRLCAGGELEEVEELFSSGNRGTALCRAAPGFPRHP